MNYEKLYKTFIMYCKKTTPTERLEMRNKSDLRLRKTDIYTEFHHIVPKHEFVDNSKENLIELLPEEHVFAHQIRWKAFKQRGDILAVRFCLNGFTYRKNNKIVEAKLEKKLNKALKQGYIWVRQNSAKVRKTHGWQSSDGLKRISEARKGTMPVRDQKTGEMIGAVDVNHPRVLSGEWAHHMKGRTLSPERASMCSCPGKKNGRYSGYTDNELLDITRKYILKFGKIDEHFYIKYPKYPKSFSKCRFSEINNKSGLRRFKIAYANKYGEEYPKYIKTKEHKMKLSKANKGKTFKIINGKRIYD